MIGRAKRRRLKAESILGSVVVVESGRFGDGGKRLVRWWGNCGGLSFGNEVNYLCKILPCKLVESESLWFVVCGFQMVEPIVSM